MQLGTTPLFGKIDNPLGSNINAPSAGWTRIVPDSVYSTPDGIGPLLPDYQVGLVALRTTPEIPPITYPEDFAFQAPRAMLIFASVLHAMTIAWKCLEAKGAFE